MKLASLLALPAASAALIIATSGPALAAGSITVSPSTGLTNGQSVTVSGTGFPASAAVFIVECHAVSASGCDTSKLGQATADASGKFSATFKVFTGTVGDGTCAAGSSCFIVASTADKAGSGQKSISFKAAASSTPTTAPSTSGSGSGTPSSVAAGDGGQAGREGAPLGVLALAVAGGAAVVAGGVRAARR